MTSFIRRIDISWWYNKRVQEYTKRNNPNCITRRIKYPLRLWKTLKIRNFKLSKWI